MLIAISYRIAQRREEFLSAVSGTSLLSDDGVHFKSVLSEGYGCPTKPQAI
jgi:hypothetical protein